MTPLQFETICLITGRLRQTPSREAARLVLIEGLSMSDAARRVGVKQPTVSESVERMRAVAGWIERAWVDSRSQD